MKQALKRWRDRFLMRRNLANREESLRGPQEAVYLQTLHHLQQRLEIDRTFYPFGGAASAGLLVFLARMATELPVRSVLEVGSGQTSLLLHDLRTRGHLDRVVSIEHDAQWAQRIGDQVEHDVIHAPLATIQVEGQATAFPDCWDQIQGQQFDAIIVDGPIGVARFSRVGGVRLLKEHRGSDFIWLIDDLDRRGEQDTFGLAQACLRRDKVAFRAGGLGARARQGVLAGGSFEPAAWF